MYLESTALKGDAESSENINIYKSVPEKSPLLA